jgi:hypothetical protein
VRICCSNKDEANGIGENYMHCRSKVSLLRVRLNNVGVEYKQLLHNLGVSVASVILYEQRIIYVSYCIAVCGLFGPTVFFCTLSYERRNFG